jgi:hypothetical protein
MRRYRFLPVCLALGLAVTAWVQTTAPPLPSYLPAGALLTVETNDFGRHLADWNASPEKSAWLASDNHAVFSRSKLFMRLNQAREEVAAAAALPGLDAATLLTAVAGGRSALALYDVGELRLVYITEISRARAIENALWRARADFEPRRAGGQELFTRRGDDSGRELAFAVVGDRFLLATSTELLAGALELLSGTAAPSVAAEEWYADAAAEADSAGDVRLAYNLRALTRTPHFRSYWIHQNITELASFRSGVVDIERASDEIRERRVLLRSETGADGAPTPAVALARLAPPEAGFIRASSRPSAHDSTVVLRDKLLAPDRADRYGGRFEQAPNLSDDDGLVGSESQLETRIDQPPAQIQRAQFEAAALTEFLSGRGLQALLLVHQGAADGPWPRHSVAVALQAAEDWPEGETLAAIIRSSGGLWTIGGVGTGWAKQGDVYQMAGLKPLFAAIDGPLLALSDNRALLESVWARRGLPAPASEASVVAEWRRVGLQAPFESLFGRLEHQSGGGYRGPGREPQLFSENVAGLGRAMARVGSMRVERIEQADRRVETVVYGLE